MSETVLLSDAERRALSAMAGAPLVGGSRWWTPRGSFTPRVTHATIGRLADRGLALVGADLFEMKPGDEITLRTCNPGADVIRRLK